MTEAELVERVAQAIENAPRIFVRRNKAEADQYEVCEERKADPAVIGRYAGLEEAQTVADSIHRYCRARYAIAAIREKYQLRGRRDD